MAIPSPSSPTPQRTVVKARRRPRQHLTGRQQQALEQLAAGAGIRDTAAAIGVDPRTVHRWLHEDPHFRAAYNAWQQQIIDSSRSQLLTIAADAVTAVSKSVKKGDARTAMSLLKHLSIMPPPPPVPSDPDILHHAIAIDREEQKRELDRRARTVDRDDLSPIANEERRNLLDNPTREYIAELRDLCDILERELDLRDGKPLKPRPSKYVRPVRDPQTGELIYDVPSPDGAAHQPPAPPSEAHREAQPPPAREPAPLDPPGPIVPPHVPNTTWLKEP